MMRRDSTPRVLAVGLAWAVIVAALALVGVFAPLDNAVLDRFARHAASPAAIDDRVLIIAIDDRALELYGRWPWPRAILAASIDELSAVGAEVIALDVLLVDPSREPNGDAALADALAGARSLVLASARDLWGEQVRAIEPLPRFARHAEALGLVSVGRASADGLLRRIPEPVETNDTLVIEPLGIAAARALDPESVPPGAAEQWAGSLLSWPGAVSDWESAYPVDGPEQRVLTIAEPIAIADLAQTLAANRATLVRLVEAARDLGILPEAGDAGTDLIADARAARAAAADELAFLNPEEAGELADDERALVDALRAIADNAEPLVEALDDQGTELAQRRDALAERVAGGVCFVGWLATGASGDSTDSISTPIDPVTPGVVVHARIAEAVLTSQMIRETPAWAMALLSVALGGALAWAATRASPLLVGIALIGALVAVVALALIAWANLIAISPAIPAISMAGAAALVTSGRAASEARQRREIVNRFKQYVAPTVVERLVSSPELADLSPEARPMTVMFVDFAGFTRAAEGASLERVAQRLTSNLETAARILHDHGATIDKFMGDGVMAFWGAPIATPDHAQLAADAAESLIGAFGLLESGQPADPGRFRVRMGFASGQAIVGDLGAPSIRSAYTAVGDPVNVAARLERATRALGVSVLASDAAISLLAQSAAARFRRVGRLKAGGRDEPIDAWARVEPRHDGDAARDVRELSDALATAFREGRLDEAARVAEALSTRYGDPVARRYAETIAWIRTGGSAAGDFRGTISV